MPHKTLQELLDGSHSPSPYPNDIIKVKVVKVGHTVNYRTSAGDEIQIKNFSIADSTNAMLSSLNDHTKHALIAEDRSLHVRNFICKDKKIVMTAKTKIFSAQNIEVSSDVCQKAVSLITPNSPMKSVKQVESSPLKDISTITGQIIKDEAVKRVIVNGNDTPIRMILVEDSHGDSIEVTLWRQFTESDISIGDFVEITQCIKGEWMKKINLSTTRNTTIQKIEPPQKSVEGQVEGINISEDSIELCVCHDDIYHDYVVSGTTFYAALGIEETDEDVNIEIANRLPLPVKLTIKGNAIICITSQFQLTFLKDKKDIY